MYRCLLIVPLLFATWSLPIAAQVADQPTPVDQQALLKRLAEIEVFHDHGDSESVTMSPDRGLLQGFKAWGDPGLKQLRRSMEDNNRHVRHHAVLLLAELPGGNDLLLESLNDKTCTVRENILNMIGVSLRDERFIAAAGELITDSDEQVSILAIGIAGRTHYLKVASQLLSIMRSDDSERSLSAAYALAEMGIPQGADLICRHARENIEIPFSQGQVISTLRSSGSPDAAPYLIEMFDKGMAMTGPDDEPAGMVFSGPEHEEMLHGKTPKGAGIMLSQRSASAIAAIGHRCPMPSLQQGLQHPNKYVRDAALQGLGAGDPTAGAVLMELLASAEPERASQVLYALSRTNDKGLVNGIAKHLKGPNHDDAVSAIAALGDMSVMAAALQMVDSDVERTKHLGVIALAKLSPHSQSARERLVPLFDDPSQPIQSAVFGWIGVSGISSETEALILTWAQQQSDVNRIVLAVRALAGIGSSAAVEYLCSLADSTSANVRYSAALALDAITGEQQIFVRDSGEQVDVVPTAYYAAARRHRLAATSEAADAEARQLEFVEGE